MTLDYEVVDEVGVITIDYPPVNALSQLVREGLRKVILAAQTDSSKCLVILCAGRTFVAGADISEFGKPAVAPSLPEVLSVIEGSRKPVVAAMHGSALGGGFELALACHYRCATPSTKVGLPEVKLGLLPGAGGTQRVPRLAGVEAALDFIISGKPISADMALRMGMLDRIFSGDLRKESLEYAREIVVEGVVPRNARDIVIDPASFSSDIFDSFREKLKRRTRGQLAPQKIVNCIEAATLLPMDEGLKKERENFIDCRSSRQSAALRHMFFAERNSPKILEMTEGTTDKVINSVAVIGGGTMGCGIAMCFANAGIPVTLVEVSSASLGRGMQIIEQNYAASVSRGKFSEEEAIINQQLISGTTQYTDLSDCDLVIEAVFESYNVKKDVFTKLDEICKSDAILATNTSYLDVNRIAGVTNRPESVVGLHFFSPANVMKLVEVVRGGKTSDEVLMAAMDIAKKIQKIPVLSGVCYGFIGNRMLRQYVRETQLCLIEGSSPEQIDRAMEAWGMAMGPLSVGDLSGLDIAYKARQSLSDEEKGDPKTYCIPDALVEKGRLGQKTSMGYYRYNQGSRARRSDPEVQQIIRDQAERQNVTRREITDDEIIQRLTLALINEGFKILEEGIAQRSSDIDVVYVFGYGFPAFRGGPMFYASELGIPKVYEMICNLRAKYGAEYWTPSKLLESLALKGETLTEWAES